MDASCRAYAVARHTRAEGRRGAQSNFHHLFGVAVCSAPAAGTIAFTRSTSRTGGAIRSSDRLVASFVSESGREYARLRIVLRRDGNPTENAELLLRQLGETQAMHLADRARLEAEVTKSHRSLFRCDRFLDW
jgi:predicted outer membrane repeat protein